MSKKVDNRDEEIADLEQDAEGWYSIVKVNKPDPLRNSVQDIRQSRAAEFFGGFVIGLEALENFMVNVKKFSEGKGVRKNG